MHLLRCFSTDPTYSSGLWPYDPSPQVVSTKCHSPRFRHSHSMYHTQCPKKAHSSPVKHAPSAMVLIILLWLTSTAQFHDHPELLLDDKRCVVPYHILVLALAHSLDLFLKHNTAKPIGQIQNSPGKILFCLSSL